MCVTKVVLLSLMCCYCACKHGNLSYMFNVLLACYAEACLHCQLTILFRLKL